MLLNEPANADDISSARMIADIEAMVRREGARQYTAADSASGYYRAHLCGVKAYLMPKAGIRRIYTPDTDIMIRNGEPDFIKGNMTSLRQWHRHLMAWRNSMRATTSGASRAAA